MAVKLRKATYDEADDYCLRHYDTTLAEKLEEVEQTWLDKLEEQVLAEQKEVDKR